MDNNELNMLMVQYNEINTRLGQIDAKIDNKFSELPCLDNTEKIGKNTQAIANGKALRSEGWNWKKFAISIWVLFVTAVAAFAAIASYVKK